MEHYYQPEIECASADQIRAWQDERLAKTVKRVYEHVEFYKKKMDQAGVRPEDIQSVDDLHRLPTTCGTLILTDFLRRRFLTAYASSLQAARPGAGWLRFIRSMT